MISLNVPRKLLLSFSVLSVMLPVMAHAQRIEITPFVGYRLGGSLNDLDIEESFDFEDNDSQGIILDIAVAPNAFVEILYSTQETKLEEGGTLFLDNPLFDIDVDYWHVGGLYQFEYGRMKPFVVATLGITELDPQPRDLDSETKFSMGIGGGVKLMLAERLALRLEGRGFSTLVDTGEEVFCNPHACYGYDSATFLWQFEARAGVVLAF